MDYPLEIENVGEDAYIVMSRGHHDPALFMAAVREAGYDWPLGMPTHCWVRSTPAPANSCYSRLYSTSSKPGRGAFPATYAHEAYGDDRYEAIQAAHAGERQGDSA